MALPEQGVLGRGWSFPLRPRNGSLMLANPEEAVRNSIFLILSTAKGERRMRPDFGCGIHELVFRPNTPALRGMVRTQVRESLILWEPRIDIIEVTVESSQHAMNQLLIRIDYRLRTNNALFNLVYPYFLQEGVF